MLRPARSQIPVRSRLRPADPPHPHRGDSDAIATAINDQRQAVGTSGTCGAVAIGAAQHALLWQAGKPIDLGEPWKPVHYGLIVRY